MKRIESIPWLTWAMQRRRFVILSLLLLLSVSPATAGAASNVQEGVDPTIDLEPFASITPFDPSVYQKINGPDAGDGFTVAWEGHTAPGTTPLSYDVQFMQPGDASWNDWLTGASSTSAFFALELTDPDGEYAFRVRATNSEGSTGPFLDEFAGIIIVDRLEPLAAGFLILTGGGRESLTLILSAVFVALFMVTIVVVWLFPQRKRALQRYK